MVITFGFHFNNINPHVPLYWYHYGECIRDLRLTWEIDNTTPSCFSISFDTDWKRMPSDGSDRTVGIVSRDV